MFVLIIHTSGYYSTVPWTAITFRTRQAAMQAAEFVAQKDPAARTLIVED